MPADLDELLREATGDPEIRMDADDLWTRGRRRRRWRLMGTSAAGLTALALVAVVVVGGVPNTVPVIEPVGEADGISQDEGSVEADGELGEDDPGAADTDDRGSMAPEQEDETTEQEAQGEETVAQDLPAEASAADAERLADPCGIHEGGEIRAFIDVVSPVEGWQVAGQVELIGCSSVHEGTIQYRVVDAQGVVLTEGFTTATAGGPEIGEFRETIDLPATGELVVEVYWEDMKDGSERDLQRVTIGSVA